MLKIIALCASMMPYGAATPPMNLTPSDVIHDQGEVSAIPITFDAFCDKLPNLVSDFKYPCDEYEVRIYWNHARQEAALEVLSLMGSRPSFYFLCSASNSYKPVRVMKNKLSVSRKMIRSMDKTIFLFSRSYAFQKVS